MIGRPDSRRRPKFGSPATPAHRGPAAPRPASRWWPIYPDQHFFERSDNIVLPGGASWPHASSFSLHHDYHQPSDEVERIDPEHLDRAAEAVSRAVRLLADGDPPVWHPGGRPAPPSE
jgi:hypothetical protein